MSTLYYFDFAIHYPYINVNTEEDSKFVFLQFETNYPHKEFTFDWNNNEKKISSKLSITLTVGHIIYQQWYSGK